MSNFLDAIKVTDNDKKEAMASMIYIMLCSPSILSLEEILQVEETNSKAIEEGETRRRIQDKLSENEILATYNLAKEVKMEILSSSGRNKKLIDYLELGMISANKDKIFIFINESVKDIENFKKINPNAKWKLQTNKILSRIEGNDPTEDETLGYESIEDNNSSKSDNKIIKFPDSDKKLDQEKC